MKKTILSFLLIVFGLIQNINCKPQDTLNQSNKSKLDLGVDIKSRYIWRGLNYGEGASFQPCAEFSIKGLKIGTFGSYNFIGNYAETDFYASYTHKGFSLIITDYFFPKDSALFGYHNYFNYEAKSTLHTVEVGVSYKGKPKFPIKIFAGFNSYGFDKDYSAYFETGYSLSIGGLPCDLFIGFTPYTGIYATDMGVVNTGITINKDIKINTTYALQTNFSIICNTVTEGIYFVYGIKL